MKPVVAYGGYAALALSLVLLSSRSAYSGGQASGGLVRLQPTTPGSAQTGNLNISGTAIAGQFQGGGAGLADLSAGNLTTGTVPDARLGVGGDITGPLSATSVTKLRGRSVASASPTTGQILAFDGTQWAPAADSLKLPYNVSDSSPTSTPALMVTTTARPVAMFQAQGTNPALLVASGGVPTITQGAGLAATSSTDGGFGVWVQARRSTITTVTAARFVSLTFGFPEVVVDLGTNSEAMRTNGFVWREYNTTAPSVAIPIAYGVVSSTGNVLGGTGNFSVTHAGAGLFDITIDGESYSNSTFTVTITPVSTSPRMVAVADSGTPFRVSIWNSTFSLTDTQFQFSVFTANPANPG